MAEGFGTSDGRWQKAISAVRKIMRLGLDEKDVLKIMKCIRRVARRRVQSSGENKAQLDKSERVRRGQWAIRTLMALGFTESEIAGMIDVNHGTIGRVIDPSEPRALSTDKVFRLQRAVQTAGLDRMKKLLTDMRIHALDTCCDAGLALDHGTRESIESAARSDFQAIILGAAPTASTKGVYAYLAQLGDPLYGLYLVKVPPESADPAGQSVHLSMLEHELQHVIDRIRASRRKIEGSRRRAMKAPKDGTIA